MKKAKKNPQQENYEFENQSLVPGIAKELILRYFNGQTTTFDLIHKLIAKKHLKDGGTINNPKRTKTIITKALQKLSEDKLAENPSYSNWRIGRTTSFREFDDDQQYDDRIEELKNELLNEIDQNVVPVEKEIGEGTGIVYCYYLPKYLELAEIKKEQFWPCKIGRTDGDPLTRVLNQVSTALPEFPVIAIVIKTDDPMSLERAIQNILTLKKRKINSSPGSEWYLTCPDEVLAIYENILSLK